MVNRVLIRLKVVQTVYAYCQGGADDFRTAAHELSMSLSSSYELYHVMLYLLAELGRYSRRIVERKEKFTPDELHSSERAFSRNLFLEQLAENAGLTAYFESEDTSWIADSGIIKSLYSAVMETDALNDYVSEDDFSYEADRNLVRRIYKNVLSGNAELDELLENRDIHWNSDRELTDSFVLKTLKGFTQEAGADQQLLGQFGDPGDEAFAGTLLQSALENASEYRGMIALHTRGWDASRLALMDVIVMQVALAEILNIADVPVKVSINEYVELAKMFGTPGSGSFVNGVLDTLVHELTENGRLTKK